MRTTLRLVRLMARYGILCYLIVVAGLALRAGQEAGWGLRSNGDERAQTLGVTVQLDNLSEEERAAALQRLADGGMDWVRLRLDWGTLEAAQGEYNWANADALIDAVAEAGLAPVVVLDGSPAWARGTLDVGAVDNPFAPPADVGDFAAFAAAFAQRYGDRVRSYQIWDEPNIAPHWGNHRIDPVGYAQLLRAASAAIRAHDSDAYILSAALAPTADRGHTAIDEVYFLQRMIAAGAGNSMDGVAIEPFGFGHSPTNPRQNVSVLNFQRAALVRRALVAAGLADMPIWAMRFGWNTRLDSDWGTVTPEDQVAYVEDARSVAATWPWLHGLGWAIDQPDAPEEDPVWGFALNDEVLHSIASTPTSLPSGDMRSPLLWMLLSFALIGMLAVRGWRDARLLPWEHWRAVAERRPSTLLAAWAILVVVYYLATPPWLIGLCWLAAALLAFVRPRYALYGSLVLLPFYFQHKEISFPNQVLTVPPAWALIGALMPALIARAWSLRGNLLRVQAPAKWYDLLALGWLGTGLLSAVGVWNWHAYWRGMIDLVIAPLLIYASARAFLGDGGAFVPARDRFGNNPPKSAGLQKDQASFEENGYTGLMPQSAARHSGVRDATIALFVGGLLIALLGLWRWVGDRGVDADGVLRLVGTHFSPNHTALYLLRTLFVGVGVALAATSWRRNAWLVAVGVVGVALLLTASRGAILFGLPAGSLVLLGLWAISGESNRRQRLRSILRKPLVICLLVLVPVLLFGAFLVGQNRIFNAASVDSRFLLWQVAVDLWRARPLAGVGANGFFWNYPAFLPLNVPLEHDLLHPHNIWLELLTGWGVAGLLWLLALLGVWFVNATRITPNLERGLRWCANGITAALAASVAHGQVDAFLSLPDLAAWLFAAMGIWATVVNGRNK